MYLKLAFPVGLSKDATEYQSQGRWWDQSLTRWYGEELGPIGGWQARTTHLFTGRCRALIAWKALSSAQHLAGATEQGLFHQGVGGAVTDITPMGFVAGAADSGTGTGYGGGIYGTGDYGVPRPDLGVTTEAAVWDLDTFGEILVGCMADDGNLYEWDLDTAVPAVAITGAPTSCSGVFVTEQRAVVAVGAGGDGKSVAWSDLEDRNDWTPDATNQAGDFDINTTGSIVKGLRIGPQNLIVTTTDAHLMSYVDPPFVYGFQRIGSGCGAMSKGCVVNMGQQAVWWSRNRFWMFNGGAVVPVQCDIMDFLRTNLNRNQRAKISGWHNAEFAEVWWHYPSANSTECDAYVWWNYIDNTWGRGSLARLCGVEKGVFEFPLLCDPDGLVFQHETGQTYDGALPFAETGPVEAGDGEQLVVVRGVIGDERTVGQVQISFRTKNFPNMAETVIAPVQLTSRGYADLRFTCRQVKTRIEFTGGTSSRFGAARLDVVTGGGR